MTRTLVAGIGNIFFGDDGFGPEVARRLVARPWPDGVRVRDYGIRGVDLAFELLEPYDLIIFVDAVERGGPSGTLYTIEAEVDGSVASTIEAHSMTPERVLSSAQAMGARLGRAIVVGCEPETLESMGLSARVAAAVEPAAGIVERLVSGRARELESGRR